MSGVSTNTPLSYPPPPPHHHQHHPGISPYSRPNYTVAPLSQPPASAPSSSAANTQSSSTAASLAAPHQVVKFLQRIDLVQYANNFLAEGFDRIASLMDMSESDLVAVGVKRGHRRILQRELFNMKGFPSTQPLPFTADGRLPDDNESEGSSSVNGQMSQTNANTIYVNASSRHGHPQLAAEAHTANASGRDRQELVVHTNGKRKYRRHPKPDLSAPEKPPSAYVMFSNKVRDELKDRNLAFTDMAKIVGDRWKTISPKEKDEIESTAARAKEEYLSALAKYKTTDQFKRYQEYLKEFKDKENTASKHRRRAKMEEAPTSSTAYAASTNAWPDRDHTAQRHFHQAYHRGGDSSSAGLFEHEPHPHSVARSYNESHGHGQGGYSSGYGSSAAWVPFHQAQSRESSTSHQVNEPNDSLVGGNVSPTLNNVKGSVNKSRIVSKPDPLQNPPSSNSTGSSAQSESKT